MYSQWRSVMLICDHEDEQRFTCQEILETDDYETEAKCFEEATSKGWKFFGDGACFCPIHAAILRLEEQPTGAPEA